MYEEDISPSNDYLSNTSHRGDQKSVAVTQEKKDRRTIGNSDIYNMTSIFENPNASWFDAQSIHGETPTETVKLIPDMGDLDAGSSIVEVYGPGAPNDSTLKKHAAKYFETEYPFEEKSVYVDHIKKEVEIGECSVFFPDGSFNKMEKITIRAEVNPLIYPPELEAITPTLTVNAPNLRLPATVKLHTWCVSGRNTQEIYIMRCDQSSDQWKEVKIIYLEDSRYIEFSTSKFSRFGAFRRVYGRLRRLIHSPPRYCLQPIVYYNDVNFVLAVIVDTKVMEQKLKELMESNYGKEVLPFKPKIMIAEEHSIIEMKIKTKHPLHFEPAQKKLSQTLKKILRAPGPTYETLTLQGTESMQTKSITITYAVKVDAAKKISGSFACPNPSFNAQQEVTSRSRISVPIL